MQQTHRRHTTDTRTLLSATLTQPNEAGVSTAIDLTGLGTPQFKMVNRTTGDVVIAATTTGVTVDDAETGKVSYDFSLAGVMSAGVFNAWFIVTQSTETDHFPVVTDGLRVLIDSDTMTAEEAYSGGVNV